MGMFRRFLEYVLSILCMGRRNKTSHRLKSPNGFELKKIPQYVSVTSYHQKMNSAEIRVLTLEDGQHYDSTHFRLEKDQTLVFRLGSSLFGRKVKIYSNFPSSGECFARQIYKLLTWDNPLASDDTLLSSFKITKSGSFHYYIQCDSKPERRASGYLVVNPSLQCDNISIPLNCIQCVTYLSKNLGKFSGWQRKFEVAKECGYNMIHFTPIQELGASQSAYSIADQLKVNSQFFDEKCPEIGMDDILAFTDKLRAEWKMLSICDIVLNHTANESQWLGKHPECAYNMMNSPYLKAAYLLDIALHNFSSEVAHGAWELRGIPKLITNENDLATIAYTLSTIVLPRVKIEELFIVPVDTLVSDFLTKSSSFLPSASLGKTENNSFPELKIIQDPQYRRMKSTIDMDLALRLYNVFRNDCFHEEDRVRMCVQDFKVCLEKLNQAVKDELTNHLDAAVRNVVAGLRYMRVDPCGPKLREINDENPLFTRYFTDYNNDSLEEHAYTDNGVYIMAHNGWVMDADPLKNFAEVGSQIYLRRELIAWGDSVKLRYGSEPEDCPYLWKHMREYVESTVRAFDGVRLDNCHSTPIHVAEYLLDAARLIRPDLYVVAELFTNSDHTDNIFVNRLGITSLIRESMSAWDSHELGRLVYRFGGEPVGAFIKPLMRPLTPPVAPALFLDLTHDNPCPIEKRTVFDLLPSSALVAMACCATGSTMGYDLLVPHQIDVVAEKRVYAEWNSELSQNDGLIAGKRALNELHYYLGVNGYTQVFVDQINSDVVCVTRHNNVTHESVVLVAYTAFSDPKPYATGTDCRHVIVSGCVESILIEAYLTHKGVDRYSVQTNFIKNENIINGLTEYELKMKLELGCEETSMVRLEKESENETRITFTNQFKPGSIVAIKFSQAPENREALRRVKEYPILAEEILQQLSLSDMNRILYCCDGENGNVYHIPNFEPFVYCGLQGIISSMETIAINNDLGHPLCHNLREGDWLMDYTANRLKNFAEISKLGSRFEEVFKPIKSIPRFLVPCYFHFIVSEMYNQLVKFTLSLMPKTINDGSEFTKFLALGSVQFGGIVESSPLPPLSKNMQPPVPPMIAETQMPLCITIAAGLPHFAVEWVRNWGRDTFISLRGLLLLTGRFNEARYLILAYAGCLRHGLVPNLLDGGRNARYNCRDAVWWWLYTIKHYVSTVPQGEEILNDIVNRLYPSDDSPPSSVDQPLHDVIQEAMNKHFQGLCFRERNAGVTIDTHMKSAGFDNQIGVHPVTGFPFGGNEWNCGTWMDKMGSSEKAGNRGQPATPRDGSAVEIVSLCKSAVTWLAEMHKLKFYPYDGVKRQCNNGSNMSWTYAEWADKIQNNFEKCFWIPAQPSTDDSHPELIHRKQIYKDCYGATQSWSDYQLRCNYSVAMVIAPELFTPQNAWEALETVRLLLVGPLGMKTLDPDDWNYNGTYDNANDSSCPKIAHGFNYHQGPEWIWPVGYFIRARLHFALELNDKYLVEKVLSESKSYLSHHYTHLRNSNWRGLPELTNEDGAHCPHSCPTQAWSMAAIFEAVHDIVEVEKIAVVS